MVPYKSIKSINNSFRLGNVLLCTLFKLCGSCHNAVFWDEGQVMIDRTFPERKRENSLQSLLFDQGTVYVDSHLSCFCQ